MNIWHGTDDAPRPGRRARPGRPLEVRVGTWPIAPGQSVTVDWEATSFEGVRSAGTAQADWCANERTNSYWVARLGPFADGDRISYTVNGCSPEGAISAGRFAVHIGPELYVAWLWHQHQPLYRDPGVAGLRRSYRLPWVRLHALRDYYSMPALAAAHDAHLTINLTPVLLRQIDDYLAGATDVALELTRHAAEDLTRGDVDEILSTFFDADWHHQIFIHPRYRELFDQRTAGAAFDTQDIRDLQMWFNLAWFGQEFRTAPVTLITGEIVTVHKLVEQGRGFTHDAVLAMIEDQYRILRAIVPIHRRLQDAGQIEVSTTPAYHPILPLLIDTDQACVDRPGATLPRRFAHPEDAAMQTSLAWDDYLARFGTAPLGMWPAEGAVSAAAVELLARHHLHWIATDGGVLARSGRWGYRTADPDVLCQPYRPSDEHPLAVFFREGPLSDAISFRCGHFSDAREAASYFMTELEERVLTRLTGDDDRIVTIVLDGENTWGGYADDGRPFLHALYDALTTDGRLKTVTFAEYLLGDEARRVPAHPAPALTRVHDLATGSWIDEPGSAPGVDLGTWIGEPEENAAWELLGAARAALQAGGPDAVSARALDALLAAQGSDWFWWFGADQDSRNDADFDELFRAHLQAVYTSLGRTAPDQLDDFVVPHPVIWTFTRPIDAIRQRDQLAIRTHCPGQLILQIDDGAPQALPLLSLAGTPAGPRFEAIVGPFTPAARRLEFRFVCGQPDCCHHAGCRLSRPHHVALGHRRSRR